MTENTQENKVLYLTKDPDLIRKQLSGERLEHIDYKDLLDNISTDAIIPSNRCFSGAAPDHLGRFCLTGIQNQAINPNDLKNAGFSIIVAGSSFGRGSSREHAQLALIGVGVEQLVLRSAERIFAENCINYGLPIYSLNEQDVQKALILNERLPYEQYISKLLPLSQEVAKAGGLLALTKARMERTRDFPANEEVNPRPMTMAEKVIATHAGVRYVIPGQQVIADIDLGYAYELQTLVSVASLDKYFTDGYQIFDKNKFIFFEDHLALLQNPAVENLRNMQRQFAEKFKIRTYRADTRRGVEGICHTVVVERYSKPGDLILGNDSHTCTVGVNGALAIGKGASEMAAALVSSELIVTVPETIRFNLYGDLPGNVTSKDLMLHLLSGKELKQDLIGSGRVFEFAGPGLDSHTMPHDEQVVLANMAIEGQGYTGIIEPNRHTLEYLRQRHGFTPESLRPLAVYSDPDAEFYKKYEIDLSKIEPMVSLPGDTQNAVPISSLNRQGIDTAYIGSCTGGKLTDLIRAANVLKGKKINPNVKMYVQASSQTIRQQAENMGILDILREAGAEVIMPGCGACMGAGPGSTSEGEIMISDTNRNFYGRTGKGDTYLASPAVVAISALRGYITSA